MVLALGAALIAGLGATIYLISTKTASTPGGGAMMKAEAGLSCDNSEINLPLEGEIDRIELHGGLAYIYYAPQGYAPSLVEIWDICAKERKFRLAHTKE